MFDQSPEQMRASRAHLISSTLFFIVAIGTGFVLVADRGYGISPF